VLREGGLASRERSRGSANLMETISRSDSAYSLSESSGISKWEPLSQCANEPWGGEQTSERGDGIPAHKGFTLRPDDKQLPQAFIQLEAGVYRL